MDVIRMEGRQLSLQAPVILGSGALVLMCLVL